MELLPLYQRVLDLPKEKRNALAVESYRALESGLEQVLPEEEANACLRQAIRAVLLANHAVEDQERELYNLVAGEDLDKDMFEKSFGGRIDAKAVNETVTFFLQEGHESLRESYAMLALCFAASKGDILLKERKLLDKLCL